MIPFNKPYLTGKETQYIIEAVKSGKISGNGMFTKKCQAYFETHFGFKKVLLTTSCTDALEMCAILANIKPGDEVIVPSYTFVSTALAFVRQGAEIVFADSNSDNPNIDPDVIEQLVTKKTKAIVVVHYAGISCDMDKIMKLAKQHNLIVIEDAAQAIDSYYNGKPLGSIGHLAAFSFHETKNIISGEGGMLTINDDQFLERAEIVWEKGTNRSAFFRGEIDKYNWVDIGSSFLPSEVTAAFLYAQLENLKQIQSKRKKIWDAYYLAFEVLIIKGIRLPLIPSYSTNNAHMFYLVCNSFEERTTLISFLKKNNIQAVFHYLSLHDSPFYQKLYSGNQLVNSKLYTERLLRLPLFFELEDESQKHIINKIIEFYEA
jgi:dTDP-4-amino-4,6-dideoxygalactose transaminase